jgi:CheY-like chemotaxis protein
MMLIPATANAFQEDRERATDAGMDGFMSKPLNLERLRQELCSVCLSKQAPSG